MHTASLAATTAGYAMPQLWRALTKTGYFIGLSGAIGATVTYATTVRPALRAPETNTEDARLLRRRTARYLAWAGVVLLVAGYFQLAARVARAGKGMPFGDALAPDRIWHYLRAPAAKGAWIAQGTVHLVQNLVLVATAATLIALFVPAARRHTDRIALTALPLSLAVTLIAGVPTTTPADLDAWLNPVFDQAHIVSGTVWLGGLALLVALAGTRKRLGAGAGLLWADTWRRFGLVAMVCVGAVTISGLWLSWKHVGGISQLWTTGYGIALLVKILLVAGLVTAGAFNQFWLMPRIVRARTTDDTASLLHLTLRHFPKVVWGEVVLGVAVLVVLPYISGSARTEAGSPKAVSSGTLFAGGAALAIALLVSLYATAKASDALARRGLPSAAA
ncbi:CopD family protein [Kitasatospora sp. RG8]|uniref:CopD family protein n=1 Tax=Kitasatospora sp. RG8 TaxID=2820815 RepID=UPI001ADF1133|nr:CopD family protein [Kitasatospora sp. RG8]MBP0450797.1 CopD family protein [Kitasatospora sp. RG8]